MPKPLRMNADRKRGYGPPVVIRLYPMVWMKAAKGAAWHQSRSKSTTHDAKAKAVSDVHVGQTSGQKADEVAHPDVPDG